VKHPETFMIGDELLFSAGPGTYLPQGTWTDLCTGKSYPGRRVIRRDGTGPCPLTKNGMIVPIDAGGAVELHYFPRLAAEFFLAEPNDELSTQVHAAPAGDYLRLEIESRADRDYEWVVHHISEPLRIDPATAWRYDPQSRVLRVRVRAPADSDVILNIALKEPL
jgi:hypothetical protein